MLRPEALPAQNWALAEYSVTQCPDQDRLPVSLKWECQKEQIATHGPAIWFWMELRLGGLWKPEQLSDQPRCPGESEAKAPWVTGGRSVGTDIWAQKGFGAGLTYVYMG